MIQIHTDPPRTTQPAPSYTVTSDGGCSSARIMYGSFLVENHAPLHVARLQLGDGGSNNESEYLALIAALEWVLDNIGERANITVNTDSKLVVDQVADIWQVKRGPLRVMRDRVRGLRNQFASCTLEWKPRRDIVAKLGH